MSTPAAGLTRVGRIDFDKRSASFFRFARELGKKCRPRGICHAFRKTMVVYHPIDREVFHTDDPKAINDFPTVLMGEVLPSPADTLMHAGYHFPVLPAFRGSQSLLGVFPLDFGKSLFLLAKKVWVRYLFPGRKRGKGLESHINPDLFGAFGQAFRLAFYRKRDVPLARRRAMNGSSLDLALDGAMIDQLERADLREADMVLMGEGKARLWERERVIAALALKAGEPWLFDLLFAASEEGFHGEVNPHRDILQNLGMHSLQRRAFLLQSRKGFLLLIKRQAYACVLVGFLAFLKQVIVEPTALFQGFVELVYLFLGGVDPVLKHFTHAQILA